MAEKGFPPNATALADSSGSSGVEQWLAERIAARLARGLPVEAATLERLQEALGEPDPAAALDIIAADPDACEHAPLCALLFSPGEELRRDLEPMLAVAELDEAGAARCARLAAALAAPLAEKSPLTLLLEAGPRAAPQRDPGGGKPQAEARPAGSPREEAAPAPASLAPTMDEALLAEEAPGAPNASRPHTPQTQAPPVRPPMAAAALHPARPEDIEALVLRLRPQATPPVELRRVIGQRLETAAAVPHVDANAAADVGRGLCALLRHSRLAWSPARVFFMAALLERAELGELQDLTAWAVAFLDLAGESFAPQEALAGRRQALETALRQAEAFEEAQEKASFEVRMSQGQRQGYVHAPSLRAELALLDRACALVLGARGASLACGGPARIDLGQTDDPDELLRLLGA